MISSHNAGYIVYLRKSVDLSIVYQMRKSTIHLHVRW